MGEHTPMYSCQNIDCAMETSYPSDMLRIFMGWPICEECYRVKHLSENHPLWGDLPSFVPPIEADNARLTARVAELETELTMARQAALDAVRFSRLGHEYNFFPMIRSISTALAQGENDG